MYIAQSSPFQFCSHPHTILCVLLWYCNVLCLFPIASRCLPSFFFLQLHEAMKAGRKAWVPGYDGHYLQLLPTVCYNYSNVMLSANYSNIPIISRFHCVTRDVR